MPQVEWEYYGRLRAPLMETSAQHRQPLKGLDIEGAQFAWDIPDDVLLQLDRGKLQIERAARGDG